MRNHTVNFEYFMKIVNLIHKADESGNLLNPSGLSGFSGKKLIGTLQRLAKMQNSERRGSYLEVGVFQGLTLISVACVMRETKVYGIDNFSQFDPKNLNKELVHKRSAENGLNNINLINADYEDALENLSQYVGDSKIGLYFVDGPHDYRSQLVCLNLAKPYLADGAIIIVDDCNYRHVRLANRDFLLSNPEFKLLFEAYTECHPCNMDKKTNEEARDGWWNGVNVIVHDPLNLLSIMVPETHRNRRLYENEHIIHSAKCGELAPEAVSFVQYLQSFRFFKAFCKFLILLFKLRKNKHLFSGRYPSMNTFSKHLPRKNYNESLK